jgi:hypothetical protein
MPEDANVILNEFYDITESKEQLEQFIEKYKDNPEAEPVIKIATQALSNFSTTNKPIVKKDEPDKPVVQPTETKQHNVRHTILETTSSNPLMQYHRPPGVYVILPSQGKYYTDNITLSNLNEVLVRPMTAKDEILFKSPDILMNGESLIEVVKSCVPGILDPSEIPGPDFSVLMLAIRLATYGKDMPYTGTCSKCIKAVEINVDIEFLLDTQITPLEKEYKVNIDKLSVYIKPYDLRCQIQSALAGFEQQAITNNILGDEDLTDSEKQLQLGKSIKKITEITYELILRSIIKINTPKESIEDKLMIAEWLHGIGKDTFGKISKKIVEITNIGFNSNVEFGCEDCGTTNSTPIIFDPTVFFG